MKRLLLASAVLVALTGICEAQTTSANGTGTANSNSQSGAVAISGGGQGGGATATGGGGGTARAGGGAASNSLIFNTPGNTTSNNASRVRQSGSLKTTPNAIAPGLGSAGIETCYGPGVSGGVSVTGFGASFGAGQYDISCNRRLNARTLFAFGFKQQAMNVMMNEPEVQAAFGYGGNVALAGVPAQTNTSRPIASSAGGYSPNSCKKWAGGNIGGNCLYY